MAETPDSIKVDVELSPTPEQVARFAKAVADAGAAAQTLIAGFLPAFAVFCAEMRRVAETFNAEAGLILLEMKETSDEPQR